MKQKFKRGLSLILVCLMVLTLLPVSVLAADSSPNEGTDTGMETPVLDVSKSKTATALGEDYTTKVTLSLPAADYKPVIDVVFVIDDTHAGSGIFAETAQKLLGELKTKNNLSVNIGIVTFDAVARDWLSATTEDTLSGLVSLESNYDAIVTAIKTELSYESTGQQQKIGGTDLEWPLAMAQEMLKTGTGTEQHVILFSDMYGYIYRGNLTVDGTDYNNVPVSKLFGTNQLAYLALYKTRYSSWSELYQSYDEDENDPDVSNPDDFFRYSSWNAYWTIYQNLETAPSYTAPSNNGTPTGYPNNITYRLTGFEKSSVLTYDQIQSLLDDGVQMTIINNDFNPGGENDSVGADIQTIKNEMLNALEDDGVTVIRQGKTINADEMGDIFEKLENKLLYVVDAGSKVEDVIGTDFDFISTAADLILTVDGDKLEVTDLTSSDLDSAETARYGFGTQNEDDAYPFVLHYYKAGLDETGECFVWDINVPVTKDKTVQLTYTVKLSNPETNAGAYGQLDLDGDGVIDDTDAQVDPETALYTNERAVLTPVDSTGASGDSQPFPKPSVSYAVQPVTLTYVYNDDVTPNKVESYSKGAEVQLSEAPTRSGYDFAGWYSDPALTTKVTEVTMDTDKTVYAKWIRIQPVQTVTLTYVYNNGQDNTTKPKVLNSTVTLSKDEKDPVWAGYTFTGWYDEDGNKVDSVKMYKDRTVYAHWELANPVLNKDDHVAYIIGYPNSTDVRPEASITRAEVVTIFFRLLTDESRAYYWNKTNPFTDVSAEDWYNNAVSTLTKAGIIEGDEAGFRPDDPITRAEFVAIAARFDDVTKMKNTKTSFSDVLETHWAVKYIAYAEESGWVNGYEDGTFKPDQPITRAEAMKITNRVLERAVEHDHDLCEDMITWTDNTPDKWYYRDVQEATNSHDYHRTGTQVTEQNAKGDPITYDFKYEKWDKTLGAPDWAALERTWSDANDIQAWGE